MIVGSKLGVLWFIDIQDKLTIKLMTVHTKSINCLDFINSQTIITGSSDNTVKITSL
jgi:WD40 repeat protein